MDDFERRLANSMKAAAVQMPSPGGHVRHRRAGLIALAAAVLVGAVIAGTTWVFNPTGESSTNPAGLVEQFKTVEYMGVSVEIPVAWTPIRANECGFQFAERYPDSNICDETPGVRFYGSGLFDPSRPPGIERTSTSGESVWSGYIYLGDFAVFASGDTRELVQRVLGSARAVGALAINIEGKWKVTALTDADGQSATNGPYAKTMRLSFEDGRLSGQTGCNKILGNYEQGGVNGRDLDLANVEQTEGVCPDEPPLRNRLEDVRHVSEADGTLQLHAENWMIIAVLERADAEAGEPVTVRCTPGGIEVSARQVAVTPEGATFTVSSSMPKGAYLNFAGNGYGGGDPLPTGPSRVTRPIPPGALTLSCTLNGDPEPAAIATIELVDPNGYWRGTDGLDCNGPGGVYDWKGTFSGEAPTEEAAVQEVVQAFADFNADKGVGRLEATRVEIGYIEAPAQTWMIFEDGEPYLTVLTTPTSTGYRALPDSPCSAWAGR